MGVNVTQPPAKGKTKKVLPDFNRQFQKIQLIAPRSRPGARIIQGQKLDRTAIRISAYTDTSSHHGQPLLPAYVRVYVRVAFALDWGTMDCRAVALDAAGRDELGAGLGGFLLKVDLM